MLTTNASLLNAAQLDAIMRGVIAEHATKLDRIAAIEKLAPDFDVAEAVRLDLRMGWAFRLFDAQGVNARLRDEDREVMTAAGLDASDIATVERHLGDLRRRRMVPTPRQRLERLVTGQAALASEMNLASAQQVYFRALSLALFETDRRYAGVVPDAAEIVAAALRVDRSGAASAAPIPTLPAESSAIMTADQQSVATIKVPDGIIAIGEKLIAVRAKDENWDGKTQRQVRQICELLRRFMVEEYEFDGLASLRQTHLAAFVTFLRDEIYKHHGKSERDQHRSIAELRKIAASKPKQLQGLEGETLNRHLGNLSQLVRHARAEGIRFDSEIDITDLRSRKNNGGRARDKRAKMPANVMTRVFHAAPFVGCAAWDRPYEFKEGGLVFHRASYYGPMLLNYTGGRREEICGLCIDDVVIDGPIPYIHIAQNEFRRIKNPQSIRDIPLHHELLRLRFPEYVDLIRSLGYRRVFPDLYSPTSKSPLGDRFYDEFMPVLAWACKIEGVDLEFVLHSIRHGFNSRLKKEGVSVEDRADLMGHGGDSETSERYADPILLQKALEVIKRLPNVTEHLAPFPIQLLPWVERCEVAPFSRGRDRKRRA